MTFVPLLFYDNGLRNVPHFFHFLVFSFIWCLCAMFRAQEAVFKMCDRVIWPTQTVDKELPHQPLFIFLQLILKRYRVYIANLQFAVLEEAGVVWTCEFKSHELCHLGQITHLPGHQFSLLKSISAGDDIGSAYF